MSTNDIKKITELKKYPFLSAYFLNNGKVASKRISSESKKLLPFNKNEIPKNYLATEKFRNYSSSTNKNKQIHDARKNSNNPSESPVIINISNSKKKFAKYKVNPSINIMKSNIQNNNNNNNNKESKNLNNQFHFSKSVGKENNIIKKKKISKNRRNENNNTINSNLNINNLGTTASFNKNKSISSNVSNNINVNNNLITSSISPNSAGKIIPLNNNINNVNSCAVNTTGNIYNEYKHKIKNGKNLSNNINNKNPKNKNNTLKTKSTESDVHCHKNENNSNNFVNIQDKNINVDLESNKQNPECFTKPEKEKNRILNKGEKKNHINNNINKNINMRIIKNISNSSSFNINYGKRFNNINIIKNNNSTSDEKEDLINIEELHYSMVEIYQNFKHSESLF